MSKQGRETPHAIATYHNYKQLQKHGRALERIQPHPEFEFFEVIQPTFYQLYAMLILDLII